MSRTVSHLAPRKRSLEELARAAVAERSRRGLLRSRHARPVERAPGPRVSIHGRELVNFASNGYLGLSTHPEVISACIDEARRMGTSSAGSRLVCGSSSATEELESALAELKGQEDTVVFSSGYLANLGVAYALGSALDPREDTPPLFLSDALNHASLIDGCRLARAEVEVYRHADALDARSRIRRAQRTGRRAVILTESRFSMDGDVAPLEDLADIAEEYCAGLIVDEAHSTGIDGGGRGLVHALGLTHRVDLIVGTLGKALGAHGAFVAGSRVLIQWLENAARTFVFTTGLPAPLAAAARTALSVLERERPDRMLARNIARLHEELRARGLIDLVPNAVKGPIIPIILGDAESTTSAGEILERRGLLVAVIRPPTVPAGTSRLRVSVRADHSDADIVALVDALVSLRAQGVIRRQGPALVGENP